MAGWLHKMLSLTVCKASDQMFSGIETLCPKKSCFVMTWSNVPKETMKATRCPLEVIWLRLGRVFHDRDKARIPTTLGPVQNHRCGKSMETGNYGESTRKKKLCLFSPIFLPIFVRGARASNQTALPGDERISAPPLTLDSNWQGNSRPWTAKT